jgi:hypothetical protein
VSVPTFIDPIPRGSSGTSYFEVIASPSLYGTQTVRATLRAYEAVNPTVQLFIHHYEGAGKLVKLAGLAVALQPGDNRLSWRIPDIGGHPIYRVGLELSAERRLSGHVTLLEMDWSGAPEALVFGGAFDLSPSLTPWDVTTYWVKSFVSSARHFAPDVTATFCLSHPGDNGVITTGTRDWVDYEVSSRLMMDRCRTVGLVARARGHRRYYAAVLRNQRAAIIKRVDGDVFVLNEVPFSYAENAAIDVAFSAAGSVLAMSVDGRRVVAALDDFLRSGGAGFLIEEGTVPARGFAVRAVPRSEG